MLLPTTGLRAGPAPVTLVSLGGSLHTLSSQMSAYQDFVADFPVRCRDVLRLASEDAEAQDREVTLLLVVASASLIVPFERLRGGMRTEHPAYDRINYPDAAARLDKLLNRKFLNSVLWNLEPQSWEWNHLVLNPGGPDAWNELRTAAPMPPRLLVQQLLAIIRYGLAHGSVFTTGDPISSLIFVSERRKDQDVLGHQYVRCSPSDFRKFLDRWFDFLQHNRISQADVAQSLAAAA